MNTDGSDPRRITPSREPAYDPTWSSDGKHMAFISSQGAERHITIITIDSAPSNRLPEPKEVSALAYSPDGMQLVFVTRSRRTTSISRINSDGSDLTQIVTATLKIPNTHFNFPTWASDGRSIAYASNQSGSYDIFIATLDGQVRQLTTDPLNDFTPAWSPDGRYIAFASDRENPLDPSIYIMRADGSEQHRLTSVGNNDIMPAWSPDGKQLAFVSFRHSNSEIYVINIDGTNETRLTTNTADDVRPVWEPSMP